MRKEPVLNVSGTGIWKGAPDWRRKKAKAIWAPTFGFVSWLRIQCDQQPLTLGSKPFGPWQTVPSNCEPKQTLLSFNCFIILLQRQGKQCCTYRISDVNISVKNPVWNLPGYALWSRGPTHWIGASARQGIPSLLRSLSLNRRGSITECLEVVPVVSKCDFFVTVDLISYSDTYLW